MSTLKAPEGGAGDPSASSISLNSANAEPHPADPNDPDAPGAPISVPDSGETGEGGKLKMIIALVKRSFGVKDIAAMRLSLPASLLEPIPNLEYWTYIDRPDLFSAINDSPDPLQRMLAVLRFTFTKDLKFVKGKICKPYNSVLGEHFRSHWDITPITLPSPDSTKAPIAHQYLDDNTAEPHANLGHAFSSPNLVGKNESRSSLGSFGLGTRLSASQAASTSTLPGGSPFPGGSPLIGQGLPSQTPSAATSVLEVSALGHGQVPTGTTRVAFLTEQVSHHPPISAWIAKNAEKDIIGCGVDQISAKIGATGTLKVLPGPANKGIFIFLGENGHGKGEQYRVTHPTAIVNGILRGSFYATISEQTIITCVGGEGKEHLRAIVEYKEEAWLGKPRFLFEGVIHTYEPTATTSVPFPTAPAPSTPATPSDPKDPHPSETWIRIKDVPKDRIRATFEGNWHKKVTWKLAGPGNEKSKSHTLLDLSRLLPVPKHVRPLEEQQPNESRKLWASVTDNLVKKEYSEATKHKLEIEQRQRDIAAERKKNGTPFVPVFFEKDYSSGAPVVTAAGLKALEEELKDCGVGGGLAPQ